MEFLKGVSMDVKTNQILLMDYKRLEVGLDEFSGVVAFAARLHRTSLPNIPLAPISNPGLKWVGIGIHIRSCMNQIDNKHR